MKTNQIFHSSSVQHVGQSPSERRYRAPWSDRTNNTIIIIKYDICRVWQIRWVGMLPPPGNILTLHLDVKVEFMLHLFSMKSLIFQSDSSSTLSEHLFFDGSVQAARQPLFLRCLQQTCEDHIVPNVFPWVDKLWLVDSVGQGQFLSKSEPSLSGIFISWDSELISPFVQTLTLTEQPSSVDILITDPSWTLGVPVTLSVRVLQDLIRVTGGTWVLPIKWHTPLLSWLDVPAASYADMLPFFPLLVLLFTCDMVLLYLEP